MGIWNTKLYGNDFTCDVKDTYLHLLEDQMSEEQAYEKLIKKYNEVFGTDEESLFWFALADTQWQLGRLSPIVKKNAINWINKNGGIGIWEKSKGGYVGWIKTLENLKTTLNKPMPIKKVVKKREVFTSNPWDVGDIYAYQFHTIYAKENRLINKYILFQKIGNDIWSDNQTLSIIQVFDKTFDIPPDVSSVKNIRVLPLTYPPGYEWMPNNLNDYIPSFDTCLRAIMPIYKKSDYPKKYFTYIGNLPVKNIEFHHSQYSTFGWEKNNMEKWLVDYFINWQGKEY